MNVDTEMMRRECGIEPRAEGTMDVRLELTFLDRCNVHRMEDLEWFQKVWFNY